MTTDETEWTAIAGKLLAAGFTASYEHVSYDPQHPLWSANASRTGRRWSAMSQDLRTAFLELEKQILDDGVSIAKGAAYGHPGEANAHKAANHEKP
jgi:hypothetical protein